MKALKSQAYQEKFTTLGVQAAPLDAKGFEAFFHGQVGKYANLIEKFHIQRQ